MIQPVGRLKALLLTDRNEPNGTNEPNEPDE